MTDQSWLTKVDWLKLSDQSWLTKVDWPWGRRRWWHGSAFVERLTTPLRILDDGVVVVPANKPQWWMRKEKFKTPAQQIGHGCLGGSCRWWRIVGSVDGLWSILVPLRQGVGGRGWNPDLSSQRTRREGLGRSSLLPPRLSLEAGWAGAKLDADWVGCRCPALHTIFILARSHGCACECGGQLINQVGKTTFKDSTSSLCACQGQLVNLANSWTLPRPSDLQSGKVLVRLVGGDCEKRFVTGNRGSCQCQWGRLTGRCNAAWNLPTLELQEVHIFSSAFDCILSFWQELWSNVHSAPASQSQ